MYNPNSFVAFWGTQPKIGRKQSEVLEAIIELGTCSDSEICEYLKAKYPLEKWAINKITNRRGELKAKDLIVMVNGAYKNEDGYPINKYRVNSNYEIEHSRLRPEIREVLINQIRQPKLI